MKRHGRLAAIAVVTVAAVGLIPAALVGRAARADEPVELQVLDSIGLAAPVGITTRVPAESDGGLVFTKTALNLDKSTARAAGAFLGELADSFLITSSPFPYTYPTQAIAQRPSGAFPQEATVQGGFDSPAGSPIALSGGHFHAKATTSRSVSAEATGARGAVTGVVTVDQGTAVSHSDALADGSVRTEATTTASGVSIGSGVLTIGGLVSRALAVVPASGVPRTELTVRLSGVSVNGVPAEITSDGLAIGGQSAVTAAQVAMFNDGLASLQQAGITVRALPTAKELSATLGEVRGAAVEIRYREADAIGGDEQFLLGRVMARSVAVRRAPALDAAAPGIEIPALGGTEPSNAGGAARTSAEPSLAAGAPGVSGSAAPSGGGAAYGTSGASSSAPTATGVGDVADATLAGSRRATRVAQRLRRSYGIIVLVAFLGAIALLVRERARLT